MKLINLFSRLILVLVLNVVCVSFFNKANAQSSNAIIGTEQYYFIDRAEVLLDQEVGGNNTFHSGMKPYKQNEVFNLAKSASNENTLKKRDTANLYYLKLINYELTGDNYGYTANYFKSKKPILKHFYHYKSDFYTLNVDDFYLKVNPIIYFSYLNESDNDESLFINTRGLEIRGAIKSKLGFYASVTENQARFPSFLTNQIYSKNLPDTVAISKLPAVPGIPYFRNFKNNGVDYFNAEGHISVNPIEQINVQFGHGKHFIGNGFRSLILSNNSANSLYLKFQTNVWKLQYTNLFMQLVNQFEVNADGYREPKYMALHHLSYNIRENLNISFFESVIFGRENGFDFNYLNPLIFYRAIERDLGSPDNVMVGVDFKWNLLKHLSLYGQVVLDEFHFDGIKNMNGDWRNKMAVQAGLKYYDVANISTLDFQIEYNMARPYLYSHNSAGGTNAPNSPTGTYAHYNQPLAHPLGANFHELLLLVRYQPFSKVVLQMSSTIAKKGLNSKNADGEVVNYGGDIFRDYTDYVQLTGNSIGQGIKQEITNVEFALTWLFKPNLHFDFTLQRRSELLDTEQINSTFIGLSTRWNIGRMQYLY